MRQELIPADAPRYVPCCEWSKRYSLMPVRIGSMTHTAKMRHGNISIDI